MRLKVTVQLGREDVLAGTLYSNVRHGQETATFSYAESYLRDSRAFPLAPDMPLLAASFHSEGLTGLRAFEDCMPDRWGRNLMMRAEHAAARDEGRVPRTLFEADMLAGVNDETRQGALRIWSEEGDVLARPDVGVPREANLSSLLDSADRAAKDMDADIRDLLAAGSSLGGARPKASIRGESGKLYIAKFPKVDESLVDDVCAWEFVALELMEKVGIEVPGHRLLRIGRRAVLLTERFDRAGDMRIPYISGLTAVQGEDGGRYSYLELVEFLEENGAFPDKDIRELWKRALFSCAIGNTDNHLRNYGFLRQGNGWCLSPAFDVNPTSGNQMKYLNTAIDFNRAEADPALALDACEYFRYPIADAKREARDLAKVLKSWKKVAASAGISKASIENMRCCFEAGVAALLGAAK